MLGVHAVYLRIQVLVTSDPLRFFVFIRAVYAGVHMYLFTDSISETRSFSY